MGGHEKKTKRYSEEEKNILEKEFQKNPHPTDFLITKYARQFNVDEQRIRSWFYRRQFKKNQELRVKKEIEKKEDDDVYQPSDDEMESSDESGSSSSSSSDSSSEEEEEEEEEEENVSEEKYNYENLLRKRFTGKGIQYLVKWENCSELT
jgi:hypothetical protein